MLSTVHTADKSPQPVKAEPRTYGGILEGLTYSQNLTSDERCAVEGALYSLQSIARKSAGASIIAEATLAYAPGQHR